MALSVAAVRQRFATNIDAISGWSESKYPYDLFGRGPATVGHLAFAVGAEESEWDDDRQRASRGTETRSRIGVRFTARLKPKDQVVSYDTMLDAEHAMIKIIMANSNTMLDDLHIRLVRARRELVEPGEWFLSEIIFEAGHRLALQ